MYHHVSNRGEGGIAGAMEAQLAARLSVIRRASAEQTHSWFSPFCWRIRSSSADALIGYLALPVLASRLARRLVAARGRCIAFATAPGLLRDLTFPVSPGRLGRRWPASEDAPPSMSQSMQEIHRSSLTRIARLGSSHTPRGLRESSRDGASHGRAVAVHAHSSGGPSKHFWQRADMSVPSERDGLPDPREAHPGRARSG